MTAVEFMSTLHRAYLVGLFGPFPFGDQNVLDKSRLKTRSIPELVYFTLPTDQGNGP